MVEQRGEPFLLFTFAACRTRSSPWGTLSRLGVRRVRGSTMFPSASALRSTRSAAGCPALFAGFIATMAESDFSRPCITGYGSSPSRHGPAQYGDWPNESSPGCRAKSVRACQVLRPRRVARALAIAHSNVLPSATQTAGRRPGRHGKHGCAQGLVAIVIDAQVFRHLHQWPAVAAHELAHVVVVAPDS